ncbi:hypothetical protein AAFF_G00422600 [Aldrovandia affinis]|uniref:Uncharacterized protein n=1 Tax=Aldrovandia affinis TaxID=143900 RepID=A0AAD7T6J5_9TELE|nr:hypothetical protein AAFF_G00422600 [Aldrovandia affinis]
MSDLIKWARQRGQWDFFSRPRLLVLIGCLEDCTNEVRELAAGLLLRFFGPCLPPDLGPALLERAVMLLRNPRVQDAQTGALIFRVLLHMSGDVSEVLQAGPGPGSPDPRDRETGAMVRHLLQELEQHYLTAKTDMLLAAKTRPIHGVLTALKYVLDVPGAPGSGQTAAVGPRETDAILGLLERISLFLLGILHGDQAACAEDKEAPPSFCDMGNAIRSVIAQGGGSGRGRTACCCRRSTASFSPAAGSLSRK